MRNIFLILIMMVSSVAFPALAQQGGSLLLPPEAMRQMQMLNPQTSVFAFAGKTCPGGSEPYKGPEQALAADSGAIYCVLSKTVMIYPAKIEKCPPGSKLYSSGKGQPDRDVIWCQSDPSQSSKMLPATAKIAAPPVPAISLSGEVVRVDGNTLVLKNVSGSFGVMEKEQSYKTDGSTEVIEQTPKDPKKLLAEQEELQKKVEKSGFQPGMMPPLPFEEKKILLSALKAGDKLSVSLEAKAGNEVVRKIIRQPAPLAPPAAPALSKLLVPSVPLAPPPKAPAKTDEKH